MNMSASIQTGRARFPTLIIQRNARARFVSRRSYLYTDFSFLTTTHLKKEINLKAVQLNNPIVKSSANFAGKSVEGSGQFLRFRSTYCGSLGHKACHSFQPSAAYGQVSVELGQSYAAFSLFFMYNIHVWICLKTLGRIFEANLCPILTKSEASFQGRKRGSQDAQHC